jgi:hypothetical protein
MISNKNFWTEIKAKNQILLARNFSPILWVKSIITEERMAETKVTVGSIRLNLSMTAIQREGSVIHPIADPTTNFDAIAPSSSMYEAARLNADGNVFAWN